jgi:hypothetical protein
LKTSFISFNRDFIKLSEYFFNFKGAEESMRNNYNLIDDNNQVEFVRGGLDEELFGNFIF